MTENEPQNTQPSAELVLVQVGEDAAMVFGADTPPWLEVQPILEATSADRAHLAEEKALFNDHALDHQVPSSSIRYVRTDARKRTVELVAVERTFKLEWPSDASDVEVTYANDLLRSLICLPPEEIPERSQSTVGLLASVAALDRELDS